MIFATVGHQMPFDRMIKIVDAWAGSHPDSKVFAQIGKTSFVPENVQYSGFLTPAEFDKKMRESDIVIAHAGTGTIIKALELQKPIVVMARLSSQEETRNDHQVHTVELFEKRDYIKAFSDLSSLNEILHERPDCKSAAISRFASNELIEAISEFIAG